MFAGKGGVGKTTCAGATALHHALQGERTLIISTDPTPSLSHIFEVKEKQKPVKVLDNLYLAELGIDEIRQMWDKKFGQEVYEVFSSIVSVEYRCFRGFHEFYLAGTGGRVHRGLYQRTQHTLMNTSGLSGIPLRWDRHSAYWKHLRCCELISSRRPGFTRDSNLAVNPGGRCWRF